MDGQTGTRSAQRLWWRWTDVTEGGGRSRGALAGIEATKVPVPVNSAVCSATRLALITGRYQYRLRLGLEESWAGSADIGLPPDHPTLAFAVEEGGLIAPA
jgi:hypothetical protein